MEHKETDINKTDAVELHVTSLLRPEYIVNGGEFLAVTQSLVAKGVTAIA